MVRTMPVGIIRVSLLTAPPNKKENIMNSPHPVAGSASKHHPLLIIAAIAVILFCLAGTAAIMGWIPSSIGGTSSTELTESDRAALASRLADDRQAAEVPRLADIDRSRDGVRLADNSSNLAPVRYVEDNAPAQRSVVRERDREPVRVARAETPEPKRSNWCGNCGNIESIREITQRAQGTGLGAAGGAVLGGLLGNQIGGGNGRKLATVAGAVGGAVVGNQVEGNMKATRSYEIRVRLDDGSARTFQRQNASGFSTGERVKIVDGQLRSVS